jgi:hypothetical protein
MTYDEHCRQVHQTIDDIKAALRSGDAGAAETAGDWIDELYQPMPLRARTYHPVTDMSLNDYRTPRHRVTIPDPDELLPALRGPGEKSTMTYFRPFAEQKYWR